MGNYSFAQSTNIERQDQIIRQQQKEQEKQKRQREFDKIKKERDYLKKQEDQDKELSDSIDQEQCFNIEDIEIIGANSLSKRQKRKIRDPFLKQCFTRTILLKLVEEVNQLYRSIGLVTTQVTIPQQNLADGRLKINVIEGEIEEIIFNEDSLTDRMQQFTAFGFIENDILDIDDINQGVYQINRLKSNNAKIKVEPGDDVGKSKIIINNEFLNY